MQSSGRQQRGFAVMDPDKQKEIARKGGKASGGRNEYENLDPYQGDEALNALDNAVDERDESNFAEPTGFQKMDPDRVREIARKGGKASSGSGGSGGPLSYHADELEGPKGSQGFASMDPQKQKEIARKGGKASRGPQRREDEDWE